MGKMILAKYLWVSGSLVVGILGTIHLIYTFFTNKFYPRNERLMEDMNNVSPILSGQLSMWKAWIGFNASHSSGIMFLAVINCFIAIGDFSVFQKSHFFFLFNIITIGFYVFLAKKYWFTTPVIGASITLICYVVAYVLTLLDR